jgi:hypothetical protein
MSVSCGKLKENCDAVVNSGSFNKVSNRNSSSVAATSTIKASFNNGTKLNHSDIIKLEPAEISIVKQDTVISNFQQIQYQNISDVQKVLKQEQELQKQLYSGSNVAPGWLRVNHKNKVIYIR